MAINWRRDIIMGNGRGWARLCLMGLGVFALLAPVGAQTVTPEEQYKALIRVDQDIQPLGEHPFGENISLYNGSLSFQVTDVSASGNGPLLQLTRSYEIQPAFGAHVAPAEPVFADWALDLPRIQTFTAGGLIYDASVGHDVPFSGWQVSLGLQAGISAFRCRDFALPPSFFDVGLYTDPMPSTFELGQWWTGYHLVIPGQGDQDLLKNTDTTTQGTYPAITKNHWRLSCIQETQTANGQPGDGFVAHAPDGTAYYFNELVYTSAPAVTGSDLAAGVSRSSKGLLDKLTHPKALVASVVSLLTGSDIAHAERAEGGGNGSPSLGRDMAYLLVTKIEDRSGNTLTYHYDSVGRLTRIDASDGRTLSLSYSTTSGFVSSVTLQPSSGS
ncbi:MAG TPA: RHS repeat domain-containing protein, partial [Oleiagrimonas sp.]|nr:RHS repeat domain-containing protein [Oleiagrimonas sp.]